MSVNTLRAGHKSVLEKIFPDEVLTSPEELVVYSSDASLKRGTPLAVVRPDRVDQVQALLCWANDEIMPVYIRGSGTNLVGDCVPVRPGIVVSTLKMNRILEISGTDFVAVVEPGVNTAEFQAACEARGLYYPPDPATVKAATIGGNVVTCAGGMRALKYGVTRDFVLGVEVVLPGGDVVMFGGRNHKNVVGLDVARLIVGSEGTLGFVSKIWLKLLPKPEASASLLAGFASCEHALKAVDAIFQAGILPCALEYIGDKIIDIMTCAGEVPWPEGVRSVLLVRLDGSREALRHESERIEKAMPNIVWSVSGSGAEEEPLWEVRRRINPTVFTLGPDKIVDDVTVPRGRILEAIIEFEKIAAGHQTTFLNFGHVGDGNIHVNLMYDASDPDQAVRAEKTRQEINKAVIALGGTQSGEHGVGISKDITLQIPLRELEIMRGIKKMFDPKGIMNPGKGY
ncbi:MAG: FAD-binding protein [Desulfovibrio sp.]|jgi:D-lactate dehydrogenase (cytochrome)/glycolate oxidase|nr:FAD-binding protein [Desulfovibrio sp.]